MTLVSAKGLSFMEGGSTLVLCANAVYAVAIKPYNHVVIGLTIYVVVSIVNTKFMLFLHCGARRQMFIYRCMNVEWILFCYMGFCISYPCIASQKWHQPFSYFLLQGARVFYNILQLEYRRCNVEGYKPSVFPPFLWL